MFQLLVLVFLSDVCRLLSCIVLGANSVPGGISLGDLRDRFVEPEVPPVSMRFEPILGDSDARSSQTRARERESHSLENVITR